VRAATGGRGVDRIVEVAFDENIQADAEMLAVGGAIATYSSGPVPQVPIPFFGLMRASQTVHFVLVYTMGDHAHDVAIRDVTACLEAGTLQGRTWARGSRWRRRPRRMRRRTRARSSARSWSICLGSFAFG
jgi:NADPH:quinone reductase-like Zn-dependent oxidoreductase